MLPALPLTPDAAVQSGFIRLPYLVLSIRQNLFPEKRTAHYKAELDTAMVALEINSNRRLLCYNVHIEGLKP
jgi:hypothetical protein